MLTGTGQDTLDRERQRFERLGFRGRRLSWALHRYARNWLNPETPEDINTYLSDNGYPTLTQDEIDEITRLDAID